MSNKIKTEKKDKGVIKGILGAGAAIASLALILLKKQKMIYLKSWIIYMSPLFQLEKI